MKKLLITLASILSLSQALASELITPYPNQTCDNRVCTSLVMGHSFNYINIESVLVKSNESTAVLLLNGQMIGSSLMKAQDRSGIPHGQIQIEKNTTGSVEIYFVNNDGSYISDYGRNFHFSL